MQHCMAGLLPPASKSAKGKKNGAKLDQLNVEEASGRNS